MRHTEFLDMFLTAEYLVYCTVELQHNSVEEIM